jgi:hypothetical protein
MGSGSESPAIHFSIELAPREWQRTLSFTRSAYLGEGLPPLAPRFGRVGPRQRGNTGAYGDIRGHTFRATGVTAYLDNGGTLENAQLMAAHESPRTTKLYNRTGDDITLDEVERIAI